MHTPLETQASAGLNFAFRITCRPSSRSNVEKSTPAVEAALGSTVDGWMEGVGWQDLVEVQDVHGFTTNRRGQVSSG